jgi:transposase
VLGGDDAMPSLPAVRLRARQRRSSRPGLEPEPSVGFPDARLDRRPLRLSAAVMARPPLPCVATAPSPDCPDLGGRQGRRQSAEGASPHRRSRGARRRPPPGAPRRLSAEQPTRVPELSPRGPAADGCRGERWSRRRLAAIFRLDMGVASRPRQVARLLNALGWRPRQPARWARQRHEAPMAQCREASWPVLKKGRGFDRDRSSAWTSPGGIRCPAWCACLPQQASLFCGSGTAATLDRRSGPSRPRARSTSELWIAR